VVATITRVLTGAFLAGGDGLRWLELILRLALFSGSPRRHRRHLRQPRRSI